MKRNNYKRKFWKSIKELSLNLLLAHIQRLDKAGWIPFSIGDTRGQTISRFYIDSFVFANKDIIRGNVLEIGRRVYEEICLKQQIGSYECLDIIDYPDIDIIGDIQHMPHIKTSSYDTIICTQVLEHLISPSQAVSELYRILRPGGKLILTVPFHNNIHMEPHDYWRFTEYTLKELLANYSSEDITNLGNTASFILASLGLSSTEVGKSILLRNEIHPQFPVIIGAVAEK